MHNCDDDDKPDILYVATDAPTANELYPVVDNVVAGADDGYFQY